MISDANIFSFALKTSNRENKVACERIGYS